MFETLEFCNSRSDTLFEHLWIFFLSQSEGAVGGDYLVSHFIEDGLMGLLDVVVVSAFRSVPFDGWGSILSIEQRMFSGKESIKFGDDFVMVVFEIGLYDDGKLSFGFLEVHQQFEEGW